MLILFQRSGRRYNFSTGILDIITFIIMVVGYSGFRKSPDTSAAAAKGAGLVRVTAILLIVGWGLDFIPLAGSYLYSVLSVIALSMTMAGWNKIRKA